MNYREKIRKAIACHQFGDEGYGEWGALRYDQRVLIKRLLDELDSADKYILKLDKENKQLKEEKRLILRNVKEWIRCSKCEQLEPDIIHEKYWSFFEEILHNIFNKYNKEDITETDLIYKYHLQKENEELIKLLELKDRTIKAKDDIINMLNKDIIRFKNEKDI